MHKIFNYISIVVQTIGALLMGAVMILAGIVVTSPIWLAFGLILLPILFLFAAGILLGINVLHAVFF